MTPGSGAALPTPPVFLVGAARSGTSLLYKSLCLHPDTTYISNWVRRFPRHPRLAVLNRIPCRYEGIQRRVWFGNGGNAYVYGAHRRLVERIFPMPVEGEPVFGHCGIPAPGPFPGGWDGETLRNLQTAVAALTRAGGGHVFVNKRIANNWRIPLLREAFPAARFVEIVRDGRAVAYSLSRVDWWDDSELTWLGGTPRQWHQAGVNSWDLCAQNWVAELEAVAVGLETVPGGQQLRIHYEEFVAGPMEVLERVAAFSGLVASAAWRTRLQSLRFPDGNESWRTRLDPLVVRRIETVQATCLRKHGYAVA